MSYRNVIVFFWLTFHLCFLPRLEILLSCCFVRDLAVALIGAWQCLLKDTTNCVRRKSKLICYYTHIYPYLPHFHPLQPTSTPELPLVERKGELSVVSTNLPHGLFFFRFAREKRLRIWKDYVPSAPTVPIQNKEFTGKVGKELR